MKTAHIAWMITFILSSLGGSSYARVIQTSDTTYTSDISGVVIDIGNSGEGAFAPDLHQIQQTADYYQEHIAILHDVSLVYITINDIEQSPAERTERAHAARAPQVLEYTILGEHADDVSSWYLVDMHYLLDFSRIAYVETRIQPFNEFNIEVTVYSSPGQMMNTINWLMENVTIDSNAAMMATDYGHLQAMLDGTSDVVPEVYTDHVTTAIDWLRYGLADGKTWEGPIFGTQVSWADPWQFIFQRYSSIQVAEDASEIIKLQSTDHTSMVTIMTLPAEDDYANIQYWVDVWTSDEFAVNSGYDMTVIDIRSTEDSVTAVLNASGKYGEPFYAVFNVYHLDGMSYTVELYSSDDSLGNVLTQLQDGITINDVPVSPLFTPEEIEAMLGD